MTKLRHGLTLVEVIAAMLLFCIGALGLAATSGAVARQIRDNARRSRAALEQRDAVEKAFAARCATCL